MQQPTQIIISRTDNIGDVILTLPMAALLKQRWPNCKVSFLARDYVADVLKACPDVDAFISWDQLQRLDKKNAAQQLGTADMILHVFPRKAIAKLAKAAGIATRIGTSHRLYHWLTCNKKVNFSRKNSQQHEAQLNLALLAPLGLPTELALEELTDLIHLNKDLKPSDNVNQLLEKDKFNLLLHPLTNGNTKEWSLENFSALIKLLDNKKYNIIVTGTTNEKSRLDNFVAQHPQIKNAVGKLSLREFISLLGNVNGVVVNSTGPLHIAAALGAHVVGLFPPEKGKNAARWQPLGKNASYIEAQPCTACCNKQPQCTCMNNITPAKVKTVIESWS